MRSYGVSFHLSRKNAQLIGPHNWNTLLCMLIQLTQQDCSHQPATVYIEN